MQIIAGSAGTKHLFEKLIIPNNEFLEKEFSKILGVLMMNYNSQKLYFEFQTVE